MWNERCTKVKIGVAMKILERILHTDLHALLSSIFKNVSSSTASPKKISLYVFPSLREFKKIRVFCDNLRNRGFVII